VGTPALVVVRTKAAAGIDRASELASRAVVTRVFRVLMKVVLDILGSDQRAYTLAKLI
jgi:hypothetical protein